MKKNSALVLFLLFAAVLPLSGQLAAGYSTDGNTLAISTDPVNRLWGEFRVNTKPYNEADWAYNDRGITQAYLLIRIFSASVVSIYTGGGLGANLLSEENDKWLSINIPVGIRINPFNKLPDLFIFGEYDPMIITSDDIPIIHSVSLGFRYRLVRGEK